MAYRSRYERFTVADPLGELRQVEFRRAGFLTAGDQPELYFFSVDGREVVVGISGEALRRWQHERRYLSREEKIDLAGQALEECLAAGRAPVAENLHLGYEELVARLNQLGILP